MPFVVWISPKAGAPLVRGTLPSGDLALLYKNGSKLNRDVIIRYWDGDIEYTEDAIAALKSIRRPER